MAIKQTDLTNEQPPDEGPHFVRERGRVSVSVSVGGGLEYLIMWAGATLLLVFLGVSPVQAALVALTVPLAYKSPAVAKKIFGAARRRIRRH
ncbi:hypothetical protein [Amycolatopsis sacchari]|uniref:Uncharacterized protein n=1 Tax=Amycolatopsis sacchari TaxID=115433 RepID=A0A1I3WYS7_9PSEU|nr:hypothetical protein [Amycolatopsis sacchari]SFK12279.1 hypothetical protein SAMN05421835_11438 [Amycolatopsis sacchari]